MHMMEMCTDYNGTWVYYKPRGDSLVPVAGVCLEMDRKCIYIFIPRGEEFATR